MLLLVVLLLLKKSDCMRLRLLFVTGPCSINVSEQSVLSVSAFIFLSDFRTADGPPTHVPFG